MAYLDRDFKYRKSPFSGNSLNFGGTHLDEGVSNLMTDAMTRRYEREFDAKRSLLDRGFDALLTPNYAIAGFVKGMVDNNDADGGVTPLEGLWGGIKAGNPFGQGYEKGETSFSRVLESAGWEGENGLSKFLRGTTGFALDVLLDPTTYLSGGASALIKGTGRTADVTQTLSKMADEVGEETYTTTLQKLQAEKYGGRKLAVSKDMVNQANKAKDDVIESGKKGMTPEIAESIIKKQAIERNKTLSAEEIARDSKRLADKYNRLIGIRDLNPEGVTFGMANLPFMGNKQWAKNLTVELGDGAGLRKFSDSIGLSAGYSKLRSAIYGSQLGKLFSTTSPLYNLSKQDPVKLYDYLKFIELTRGLHADKLMDEKAIRDYGKSLGLTEAESKELLDVLQDKTVWHKVKQAVKFADTQEAKHLRNLVEVRKVKAKEELEKLTKDKDDLEALQKATDDGLVDATHEIEALKKEYRDKLINFDLKNVKDSESVQAIIKSYEDEIAKLESEVAKMPVAQTDEIEGAYDPSLYKDEPMQPIKKLKIKNDDFNVVDPKKKAVADSIHPNDILLQHTRLKDNSSLKADLVDNISRYLYGEPRQLAYNMYSKDLNALIKMINDGKSKSYISRHIDNNPNNFNGKIQEIYTFIGEMMGYGKDKKFKDWKQMYTDRLKPIMDWVKAGRELTPSQQAMLEELQGLQLERLKWVNEFHGAKTMDEVMEIIQRETQKKMEREVDSILDKANMNHGRDYWKIDDEYSESRRGKFNDDDFASDSRKAGEFSDADTEFPYALSFDEKEEIMADVLDFINSTKPIKAYGVVGKELKHIADVKNTKQLKEYNTYMYESIQRTVNEVEPLLEGFFKKSYADLSPKQRKLLQSLAHQNAIHRKTGQMDKIILTSEDFAKMLSDKDKKKLAEEVANRDKFFTEIKPINPDSIQPGATVYFMDKNKKNKYRGTLNEVQKTDGSTKYVVTKNDGEVVTVPEEFMTGSKVIPQTIDEIMEVSPITRDFVKELEDLRVKHESALKDLDILNTERKAVRVKLVEEFKQRESLIRDTIIKLHDDQQLAHDTLASLDDAKISELETRIAKYEEILTNEEAFISYAKEAYSNGRFEQIASTVDPNTPAKIMLDPNLQISEKLRNIATALRGQFIEMAEKEINIGKLKPAQVEALMMEYVPHIVEPDGARYFASARELKKLDPAITRDLGYGTKWNPYGKKRKFNQIYLDGQWIKNPTIQQINKFLEPFLQGKNAFSESIGDIYITRAMKHTELMYDHKYMETMMNVFGKELPSGAEVEEGYKAVVNFGQVKEAIKKHTLDLIKQDVSDFIKLRMSEAGTNSNKEAWQLVREQARVLGRRLTEEERMAIQKQVWEKHKPSYSRQQVRQMYKERFEQMRDKAIHDFGFEPSMLDRDATPMIELTKEQIQSFQSIRPELIRQVNDAIVQKANQARKLQIAKDQSRFLQMYDKFTHFMKLNQTTVSPAFHVRNKMSNMFLNWLGVGSDAVNFKMQANSWKTVWHKGESDISDVITVERPDGTFDVFHWNELYETAKRYQVIDEGFFAKDLGAESMSTGMFKKVSPKADPTNTANFFLYRKGAEVGNQIENSDRLIHFVSVIKREIANGKTKEQAIEIASESSKKFLFDYSDLTAFEQNVMKRLIPYYTWLRKNGRLQFSQLFEQPGKYRDTAKVLQGIEGMNNSDEEMNPAFMSDFARDWVQTPFATTNEKGQREPIMWNPNLPFMDLGRLPNPLNPIDTAKSLFSQSNPAIKVPIEQATNTNVFFDAPITKPTRDPETGEMEQNEVGDRLKHLLSQFALANSVGGAFKENGVDSGLGILNGLTGIKTMSYDYETFKSMKIKEMLEEGNKETIGSKLKEFGGTLVEGFKNSVSKSEPLSLQLVKKIDSLRPKDAIDYTGALRPISQSTYNSLSDSEKLKYVPPTQDEAFAYHKKALELSEQAMQESGAVSRFTWALFDKINILGKDTQSPEVGLVTSVTDGDTFQIKVGNKTETVRMLLVDTPESVGEYKDNPMPFGKEASERTRNSLLGKDVVLRFDGERTDKYGRVLAYVQVDGNDYNKQLIEQGLGQVRYLFDDYEKTNDYYKAEQEAYKRKQGVWSKPDYAIPGDDTGYLLDK